MSGWAMAGQIAGDILGGVVTTKLNAREAERDRRWQAGRQDIAMDFSSAEALANRNFQDAQATRQMDFQKDMASTQISRAAADAKNAGLNRILAIGQPAAAPQGASASGSAAHGSSGGGSRASAANFQPGSAFMNAASALAAIDNMKAQNELIRAQTGNVHADTQGKLSLNEAKELMSHLPSIINNLFGDKPSSGYGVKDATNKIRDFIKDYVDTPTEERPFWKKNIFEHGEAGINWAKDKFNKARNWYKSPPKRTSK